jgi:hypothetical protein
LTETPTQILQRYSPGSASSITLNPGLSEQEISEFQSLLPRPLPAEIRELLTFSSGFEVHRETISGFPFIRHSQPLLFTGTNSFAFPVFEYLVDLLHDGAGNFWVLEVDAHGNWGPVFFGSHDPPVIAIQARNLNEFLLQVLEPALAPPHRALRFVHDEATAEIWRTDPWLTPQLQGNASEDATLREFANSLPERFQIADLRKAEIGSGFSWGKAGPNADVRRCGTELLFAVEQKRPGFWSRVFSRG